MPETRPSLPGGLSTPSEPVRPLPATRREYGLDGIQYLVPLVDRYVSFTRPLRVWETDLHPDVPRTVGGHLVRTGLVTKVRESWDDTQGVPLYQGVEVMFSDASVLLLRPSQAWRWEVWGRYHQEQVDILTLSTPLEALVEQAPIEPIDPIEPIEQVDPEPPADQTHQAT